MGYLITMNASTRQTFAIFCKTGFDVRACNLSRDEAGAILSSDNAVGMAAALSGAVYKRKAAGDKPDYADLYKRGHEAAMAAGREAIPVPMVVGTPVNLIGSLTGTDNRINPATVEYVPDGVCGFAGVVVHPATCGFARWARKAGYSYSHYPTGEYFPVREFNQSLERKEAGARAMAQVFRDAGLKVYVHSRMD
jgi:hypothetical protein